jgi:hypothetical protein
MDTRAQTLASVQWDGQRISKPGIYSGIPLADYHRGDICDGPSISSSGLRRLWSQSPKHFWDASPLNPQGDKDDDDNEDFVLGRAVHHLVSGELGFAGQFVIRPERIADPGEKTAKPWHGGRKVCRDWLKQMRATGRGVLSLADVQAMRGMAVSLNAHSLVRQGILSGMVERSMFWKDRETGVWLKARPDVIPTASGDFADLKTTRSVLYIDIQHSLENFGYIQQGALVLEGARALDIPTNSFTLVWVEKKRPHCVRVSTLIDADLALGAQMNRQALRTFHSCYINKSWPGPGDDRDDAEYLQLSDRAREHISKRLELSLKEAA